MGKGNNNNHFSAFGAVVATPSVYHTSGLVTTTPKITSGTMGGNNYTVGFSGYCEVASNPYGYCTSGIVTTTHKTKPAVSHSSKPNLGQNKPVKPNQVQSKSVVAYSSKPKQVQSYETTSRIKHMDRQTGTYQSVTTKGKVSNSSFHRERGTGQVGVKNEIKKTSTVRIGNSSGYTEYHTEQRVRKVKFGNGGTTKHLTRGG